jgi:predicted CoA-binding protein
MTPTRNSDDTIRDILTTVRSIAVVGYSANPDRPSHYVAAFLADRGYRVVGVNPGLAGQTAFGDTIYASLAEIPFDIDMVDIFRRSEDVPPVVDAALARFPDLTAIWMQIGVTHSEAARKAEAAGVRVLQNRCPKVEIPRLLG